ncbi:sulfatase, partial [Steroidobacter sp.]|uniref:sulfatase family protein n=1 Tax=Steroidobacter sp. TaxID=1978227 RepID=UPI001A3AFE2E
MKRRTLLASAAGAVLGSTLLSTRSTRAASSTRRNVLLLIADDQGLDAGCYGTGIATPRIDALARGGTRFTQAYAAVSSCSPSRSVIYTGLYSHSNGMYGLAHDVHNQSLLDGIDTLPQMLKRAGYATALVGKKHVRPDSAFVYDAELAPERSGIRDVAFMADETLRFVRGVDQPFFVTVAYSDPHRAPVNYGNDRKWPRVEPVLYDPARVPLPSHLPDLPEVRRDLSEYYQSVSRLDTGIGLLLDGLRDAGHADDTLVLYLSDNGRPFPGAKTNLYDPGLHLPLIVHAPGAAGGAVNDAMVSFIDIVPTILDWTRAPAPKSTLPGRSLLPLLGKRGASG